MWRFYALMAGLMVLWGSTVPYRLARITGDDKVYVAQATEMRLKGLWFDQQLGGERTFLKGPLHFIALRAGHAIFGFSMWATLYMNVLLGLVAAAALFWGFRRFGDSTAIAIAGTTLLAIDVWLHSYASMMDFELVTWTCVAMALLARQKTAAFWIWTGVGSWIKSPANAALMGISGALFLLLTRSELRWRSLLAGVLIGLSGYVPMAGVDWEKFVHGFLVGENVGRGGNGMPWWTMLESNMGFSLLPWTFWVWCAPIVAWTRRSTLSLDERRAMLLGLCFAAPLLVFFTLHPYRHNHYGLPAIPGLLVCAMVAWRGVQRSGWNWAERAWVLSLALAVGAATWVAWKMSEFLGNSAYWVLGASAGVLVTGAVVGSGMAPGRRRFQLNEWVLVGTWVAWMGLGLILVRVGEHEMVDLKAVLREFPQEPWAYENSHHHPWSEWAYLQYMVGTPIAGLHSEKDLENFLRNPGGTARWIVIPGDTWLPPFLERLKRMFPQARLDIRPWKRWRVRPDLETLWKSGQWDSAQKEFYMVRVQGVGR